MSQMDQIQRELDLLPPEQRGAVLEFIASLRMTLAPVSPQPPRKSLREHPAFGVWKERGIDALGHQQELRAEWDFWRCFGH